MPKSSAHRTAKPKKSPPKLWEYPVGSGIKVAELPNVTAGKAFGMSYQVRVPSKLLGQVGKRAIRQFPTKQEAEKWAEDQLLGIKKHGTDFAKLPPLVQKQAAIAWGRLSEHGLNFLQAADAAIRYLRPAGGSRSLAEVIGELMVSKKERHEAGELDKSTVHDFTTRGQRIIEGLGDSPANEITAPEIIAWLK